MPDIEHPEIPSAITDEPQAAAMMPQTEEDAIKPATHEVDAGDMFNPGAE